ncbi:DUF1330 domain-containing protein [Burkholderia plantarii]|uniref:DUF1330 domain-containing protein n=1 Tax=Burkholderia plantarii TaxID=41899 RepID=UPI0006D89C3E|nr:DUF1330 domain-containing protein [Burkholderia plantarii]ALK32474.1 hypothetical protein bpln_2g01960 [Burkholderia plantarii]GLZ19023.1 hypothetical protein Bpla01_25530 [Burkholderia plantarii]
MTAYLVIVREQTIDSTSLSRYRNLAALARDRHPLTPLAYYGEHAVLEGTPAEGVAILSFPTMSAARAWYGSHEYQAALPHRRKGSVSRVLLVAGNDETDSATG